MRIGHEIAAEGSGLLNLPGRAGGNHGPRHSGSEEAVFEEVRRAEKPHRRKNEKR